MTAVIETSAAPASRPVGGLQTLKWLLKRELWEHRGGFVWAPLIAGIVSLCFTLLGGGMGQYAMNRFGGKVMIVNGREVPLSQVDWNQLLADASPEDLQQYGEAISLVTLMSSTWPLLVFAFVVFFYLLSSLYDERKDRSVLFWKSLPVSDRDTVLSKVASAAVVAPALAIAASLATMFGFLVIMSLVVLAHGGNPLVLLWGPGSPLKIAAKLAATIPVYAVWALPTIGWLLLCSAWARSKPFLWAVLIPIFAGIFVSWFDLMQLFKLDSGWFWAHVTGRLLLSSVPGSDMFFRSSFEASNDGFENVEQLLSLSNAYGAFLQPAMWIGALAGAAMIYAAIRLRRWRDDN